LHILRYATGRIHDKIPAFFAASKFSRRKWSSFAILTSEADFSVNNSKMEEKKPSFELNLEFLEPQVEEENEIEQCETDKEVEGFILGVHLSCHDESEWHGIN